MDIFVWRDVDGRAFIIVMRAGYVHIHSLADRFRHRLILLFNGVLSFGWCIITDVCFCMDEAEAYCGSISAVVRGCGDMRSHK